MSLGLFFKLLKKIKERLYWKKTKHTKIDTSNEGTHKQMASAVSIREVPHCRGVLDYAHAHGHVEQAIEGCLAGHCGVSVCACV
jgi:hypothetical protein